MPTCVLCRTNLKTRGNLACHHRLLHRGKSVGFGHVPEVTLLYFVNSVKQTLACPVDYCSFKRNNCKDVQPIANHFTRCHPHHQLFVSGVTCTSILQSLLNIIGPIFNIFVVVRFLHLPLLLTRKIIP